MSIPSGYALLDCGAGRRLERFGDRTVDRPAPAALSLPRRSTADWRRADLRFDRDRGWSGRSDVAEPWPVELDGVTLELRPTESGQVGLYPEHLRFWPWLRDAVSDREAASVLHLFAATGATTLALARAGARVTHVDGARGAVTWARRNAILSGLGDAPVRWIVDDALAFTRREARRGRRYDGIVLDPPTRGHGPGGQAWDLRRALGPLLDAVAAVAAKDAFVLLTGHATGLDPDDLGDALRDAFGGTPVVAAEPIELRATSGAVLPLGVAARMIGG
jgi:23S rRNA (cytosine1962-C5)-methyltransferase